MMIQSSFGSTETQPLNGLRPAGQPASRLSSIWTEKADSKYEKHSSFDAPTHDWIENQTILSQL